MRFYVNQHNQFQWEGPEIIIQPDYYTIHHAYNARTFENDVCMVHTSDPINMGSGASTACLPEEDVYVKPGVECYTAGWGKKEFNQGL